MVDRHPNPSAAPGARPLPDPRLSGASLEEYVSLEEASSALRVSPQELWGMLQEQATPIHRLRRDGRNLSAIRCADLSRLRGDASPASTESAEAAEATEATWGEKPLWARMRDEEQRRVQMTHELELLRAQLVEARARLETTEGELVTARTEGESLRRKLVGEARLLRESEVTRSRLMDVVGQLEALRARFSAMDGMVKETEEQLSEERTRSRELALVRDELETARGRAMELDTRLADLRSQASDERLKAEREQQELTHALAASQERAEQLRTRLHELEAEREGLRTRLEFATRVERSNARYIDRLEKKLEAGRKALEGLRGE